MFICLYIYATLTYRDGYELFWLQFLSSAIWEDEGHPTHISELFCKGIHAIVVFQDFLLLLPMY